MYQQSLQERLKVAFQLTRQQLTDTELLVVELLTSQPLPTQVLAERYKAMLKQIYKLRLNLMEAEAYQEVFPNG